MVWIISRLTISLLFCTLQKKLGDLIDKQRVDKAEQLEKVDDISDSDKAELVKNIETQCQLEQDDLSYRLKLQQDEEAEKLRKVSRDGAVNNKYTHLHFLAFVSRLLHFYSHLHLQELLLTHL